MAYLCTALRQVVSSEAFPVIGDPGPTPPARYSLTTTCCRNCSLYFAIKNTPKVRSMSNFWGAVHNRPVEK